jgi:KDO2-lipid IV(A) lauroyltransferase
MEASAKPSLYAPRHWPTWVGLALLWCFSQIASYPFALRAGRGIGRLGYLAAPRRRHIARTNLTLCFPELSEAEQEKLLREHFEAIGISLLMTGFSWWGSDEKLKPLARTEGFQHLQRGLEMGRGVLLVGMHFVDLDLVGRLLGHYHTFAVMYRQHENPVIEWAFRRNRERRFSQAIPRGDVRAVLRALRQNKIVWLAPDQAMKGKHSVLVPFFGVPAATSTTISRIAGISGATVMLGYGYRLPGTAGYQLNVRPPLDRFPGESVTEDTARVNLAIEAAVRDAPAQYLWAHRRFKKRRVLPDPY